MSYFTYILYSTKRNLFYVGSTNNISKRLLQHNKGESAFTASGIPWTLLWSTTKTSRSASEQLERKLKNLSRERKVKFILKYQEGIADYDLIEHLDQKKDK